MESAHACIPTNNLHFGMESGPPLARFLRSILTPVHAVLQFETLTVSVADEAWRVAGNGGLCREGHRLLYN